MKLAGPLIAAGTALAFATGSAFAHEAMTDKEEVTSAFNSEWVSLTGTVASVADETFTLDYGKGKITVEMDDYDRYDDNPVVSGDKVTVTGEIDNDFYNARRVEASSLYIDRLNTYYYASSADEEDGYYSYPVSNYGRPNDDEWIGMTGTVVSGIEGDEFLLDTGPYTLTVDATNVDRKLYIDKGDRVTVYGEMDDMDLFEGRELLASSIVTLSQG